MGSFHNILILITFFIEVAVLCYLELKAWKTIYTPLNFLMLPYVVILVLSIILSGKFGFVEFYYPSILFWSVGLLLFSIPSFFFAFITQKADKRCYNGVIRECKIPQFLVWLSVALCLLFVYRTYSFLGSTSFYIGSDDFGLSYAGQGFWGHLRIVTLPLLIMAIYFVDKSNPWLWIIILMFFFVGILYNVKGWIIIPVVAGMAMRLYTGKSKLKLSFFLYLLTGGLLIFLLAYLVLPMIAANKEEVTSEMLTFVFEHFSHYLVSGTYGLSIDMQLGYPDSGDFEILWAPIVNMINVITGNGELVLPINPYYFHSGINLTNVRTFFGTLFIYTNYWQFIWYTLLSSSIMYMLKLITVKWNNVYIYVIYFFECGLLAMGWFEFYYFHLVVFELPVLVLILWFVDELIFSKETVISLDHEV